MSGQRPGQIRFEAWLPADTYRQFSARVGNRKAWLLTQVQAELAKQQQQPHGDQPPPPGDVPHG